MNTEVKKYVVTGKKASFGPGQRLVLSIPQAAARKHNLAFVEGNTWEVVASVEFKYGEELGVVGSVNKVLLQEVAVDGDAKAEQAKAAAEATRQEVEAQKKAEADAKAEAAKKQAKEKGKKPASDLGGFASEKAASEAKKAGLEAADLKGTGSDGLVTAKDVAAAVKARKEREGFLSALSAELDDLDDDNDEQWDEDGSANLEFLSQKLGKPVTDADVAELFPDGFARAGDPDGDDQEDDQSLLPGA